MGFRTVLIQSPCKLTYKDGFLILRGSTVRMVHLSEIHTLIIDSTMTSVTGYLICELMKEKINVIFCDEARNPIGELHPCYGSHYASGRVIEQTKWQEARKDILWQYVIRRKILNQASLMRGIDVEAAAMIYGFAQDVGPGDPTNREGHAAKVYFNRIFGPEFSRNMKSNRNAALNYGYAILLSAFNKEITARGYLTQLGIHHHSALNPFNLSSDLMEPFRAMIDRIVLDNGEREFGKEYKYTLLEVLNREINYENSSMSVTTAIARYVRKTTDYLSGKASLDESTVINVEGAADESDRHV
ncbi:MAG: type II CRISPR-associated endonuclease Cas1 [Clostridia bacterium]|nr:type II CRISPR-associated endonuclease Cas1 [Clostridia bacterium]